jgi:Zn-dependent protease
MFWEIMNLPDGSGLFAQVVNGVVYPHYSFAFWIIVFIGLIISIAIHEFAHAYSAHLLGDDTAKLNDRMTLNPAKHFDVLGILLITFTGYGYGKPVPVNPNNFQNPIQGLMYVSLAGPVSNLLQAAVCAILFLVFKQLPPQEGLLTTIVYALPTIGFINLGLMIFNLLPIPPLDGSKIWGYFHYKADEFIQVYIAPYALLFLILAIAPILGNNMSILGLILRPIGTIYYTLLGL